MKLAAAAEHDEPDLALLSRLESDCGSGRDIQVHSERRLAVELQIPIYLEEVVMRAHLNRPVAEILDSDRSRLSSTAELNVTSGGHHLTRLNTLAGLGPRGNRLVDRHQFLTILEEPLDLQDAE
jgi:hypothetical protein